MLFGNKAKVHKTLLICKHISISQEKAVSIKFNFLLEKERHHMANACTCSHHCTPYYKNPQGKCREGTNKVDTTGHLHKSKNGAYSMSA